MLRRCVHGAWKFETFAQITSDLFLCNSFFMVCSIFLNSLMLPLYMCVLCLILIYVFFSRDHACIMYIKIFIFHHILNQIEIFSI